LMTLNMYDQQTSAWLPCAGHHIAVVTLTLTTLPTLLMRCSWCIRLLVSPRKEYNSKICHDYQVKTEPCKHLSRSHPLRHYLG
jgi:hypothetical protein